MKNIKHHSIIVTSNDFSTLELVRKEIVFLFGKNMEARQGEQLISPIIPSLINKFCSFFIAPDGSKEGYDASDDADLIRRKTLDFLNSLSERNGENAVRFVEVCYGADDQKAMVLSNN